MKPRNVQRTGRFGAWASEVGYLAMSALQVGRNVVGRSTRT